MRGRVIHRVICVLRRLDPASTSAVVGGGYDSEFRGVKRTTSGQLGTSSRRELTAIRIPCQQHRVGDGQKNDSLTRGGIQSDLNYELVMSLETLENMGLVTSGVPQIFPGDRVEAIESIAGETLVSFPNPPGLFVNSTEFRGYGLAAFGTPKNNLFVLTCRQEKKGAVE